ncbi:hypothetical protein [Flavobacterium sp. M31R6]|uniref:hypothetical protein n=1 Tax=Flavobacterium sp. M31R6 TaxID=2739062 RepID=UPI0015688B1E|nr:hypothetical protein [Flavobacterium sp. M31R6]QKJ63831.1 hypothetical protein HQN62_12055 [Flavobacterium sp. M31R6]
MANYKKKTYSNNSSDKKDYKKHSGAKNTRYTPKTGANAGVEQHLTTGWRLAGKDLISFSCVTTSKSVLSEKGWYGSVGCSVVNTKTGAKQFYWGMMEKKTGKVVIAEMALVLNPKAKNGGYCGTFLGS